MAEVKTETALNPRQAQRDQRDRRMKLVAASLPGTVKVLAANEDMRRLLKHPAGNVAFRNKIDQPVEWPHDQFTMRRLADGSVYREGETAPPAAREVDEKQSLREQVAGRRPQKTEAQQIEPRPTEATGKRPETPRGTPSEPKPAA